MKINRPIEALIIGDSTHNTLSVVRSLGEAKIGFALILVTDDDFCNVRYSKYIDNSHLYIVSELKKSDEIIHIYEDQNIKIICTFDTAAMYVDSLEEELCIHFRTPANGKHIGELFEKEAQCRLAVQCGLTVPKSQSYNRNNPIYDIAIPYPILLKPAVSVEGEKSDIHICNNNAELSNALHSESRCDEFIVQEFIDKEYEIDCIGVRTEQGMYMPGGIRKYRHYPKLTGAGAYGIFQPMEKYNINTQAVERFLEAANYYGPFSVEFLHADDKDYFMEVNFRNEGLAYAATCAGANLHALCVRPDYIIQRDKIKSVYMMNYSIDFMYVKDGSITLRHWLRDFFRTRCFININFKDLKPIIKHYLGNPDAQILNLQHFSHTATVEQSSSI